MIVAACMYSTEWKNFIVIVKEIKKTYYIQQFSVALFPRNVRDVNIELSTMLLTRAVIKLVIFISVHLRLLLNWLLAYFGELFFVYFVNRKYIYINILYMSGRNSQRW